MKTHKRMILLLIVVAAMLGSPWAVVAATPAAGQNAAAANRLPRRSVCRRLDRIKASASSWSHPRRTTRPSVLHP